MSSALYSEAKRTAMSAYEDWKKVSTRTTLNDRKLRVSDADEFIDIIARHVLLARAAQARADGNVEAARELVKASHEDGESEVASIFTPALVAASAG